LLRYLLSDPLSLPARANLELVFNISEYLTPMTVLLFQVKYSAHLRRSDKIIVTRDADSEDRSLFVAGVGQSTEAVQDILHISGLALVHSVDEAHQSRAKVFDEMYQEFLCSGTGPFGGSLTRPKILQMGFADDRYIAAKDLYKERSI
jgi:hypothetical protein